MIKQRTPAPTRRSSAGGLTGYTLVAAGIARTSHTEDPSYVHTIHIALFHADLLDHVGSQSRAGRFVFTCPWRAPPPIHLRRGGRRASEVGRKVRRSRLACGR
jgi:hypothetical protein